MSKCSLQRNDEPGTRVEHFPHKFFRHLTLETRVSKSSEQTATNLPKLFTTVVFELKVCN
jgi:hypothetical protein